MIAKVVSALFRFGFWPYVLSFTFLAVIISELLMMIQSYWLTGSFFDENLMIVGFITPLIDAFIVFFLSAFLIRHLITLQSNLQEQQEKYQNFMNLSSDGIFILSPEGKLLEYSEHVKTLLGYSDEELKDMYVYDWDIGFTKDDVLENVKNVPKEAYSFESKHQRKDGSVYDASITVVRIAAAGTEYICATVRDITDKKMAEQELIASKEKAEYLLHEQKDLLALFDKGDSVLFKWNNDEEWSIDYVSDNVAKLLGYSQDKFLNKEIVYASCIYKDDIERVTKEVHSAVEEKVDFFKHEPYRVVLEDGTVKWVMDHTVLQKDNNGSLTHFIGYIYDITNEKLQEEEIRNKLQKFVDTQNNIVILTDGKVLKFVNKMFFSFFGYENLEDFKQHYRCICDRFVEQNNFFHLGRVKENETTWIESLLNLSGRERVVSMLDKNSNPHAFSVSINKYDEIDYVVSFMDISDSMLEKLELKKEATVDTLTGFYNRIYFNKYIERILESHKNHQMQTGIIFFDIDHFKKVNDTYGHDVGDDVLRSIAAVVKKYTRDNDKLVRWGGEEFLVICEVEKIESIVRIAEHLRSVTASKKYEKVSQVTCSFGCAMHSDEEAILATIKHADEKLYIAKNSGRNRVES